MSKIIYKLTAKRLMVSGKKAVFQSHTMDRVVMRSVSHTQSVSTPHMNNWNRYCFTSNNIFSLQNLTTISNGKTKFLLFGLVSNVIYSLDQHLAGNKFASSQKIDSLSFCQKEREASWCWNLNGNKLLIKMTHIRPKTKQLYHNKNNYEASKISSKYCKIFQPI